MKPYYEQDGITIYHGDCREVLPTLQEVDAIVTDPPYFQVKKDAWDRQWDKPDAFLSWIGELCEQWQRVLAANGSLYCFASPQMRARVEVKVGEFFNCLPTVTWIKEGGWHKKSSKEQARSFTPQTEAIIFAEHYGADNIAKGEAGYGAKCDELRGFVFEPLRAYLDGERERAGVSVRQVAEGYQAKTGSRTVTGMAGHWFGRVQWALPTEENYHWIRRTLSQRNHNGDYLRREYEDLRREYEDLRREYEDLRRPFSVTADMPYTDVWNFATVQAYKGKHPCEKPSALMEHIIKASTRPDAVVLDCFAGTGSTLLAAQKLGRRAIGIEIEERYCEISANRLAQGVLFGGQS